jgi:flagellar hook-length control protein FliK
MPVAPDLLLKTTPDVSSKMASRSQATPADTGRDAGSSFSKVYKDNQAKPAENGAQSAKTARDKPAADRTERSAEPAGTEKPAVAVAEGGKALPASDDAPPEEADLDPLLLFGLSDAGSAPPVPVMPVGDLTPPPVISGESFPTDVDQSNLDADLDVMDALGNRAPAAPAVADTAKQVLTTEAAVGKGDFAEAMKAMGEQVLADGDGEDTSDLSLGSFSDLVDESAQSKTADLRTDQFVSRLNALNQAVSQQAGPVDRAQLIPGQPVAMNQNGWTEAVVDRVMWLSSQSLKSAEVQLNPQELGRMEVRIQMDQDQTQVTFASANAGVRDTLESQMHRLRDMLAQQGLNQVDVNVSDQSMNRGWQGQHAQGEADGRGGRGSADGRPSGEGEVDAAGSAENVASTLLKAKLGLVDYYA